MAELEHITPAEAKEMFLAQRRDEVAEATLQGYHYRLKPFNGVTKRRHQSQRTDGPLTPRVSALAEAGRRSQDDHPQGTAIDSPSVHQVPRIYRRRRAGVARQDAHPLG
jgi:hypothetical protein